MTRAEEKANEAHPDIPLPHLGEGIVAKCGHLRRAYIEGYKQAEKDTIERAIVWLKEHADSYIVDLTPTYPDAPQNIIIGDMCWEHLKQAL